MKRLSMLAASAVLVAAGASAQVTHNVTVGPTFSFSLDAISIDVGDTVLWTWAGALFHSVESGVGGVPDGIFGSGAPVAGAGITFSVTFDQAFVNANPVSGGVYDYFCIVHIGFGMTGTVTINQGVPYGCGVNPSGSLTTLSGKPKIGTTWTVGIDNPLGTQPSGAAFLRISLAPAPGFPCGTSLPGFGMTNPGVDNGELLIDLGQVQVMVDNVPWTGTGNPAAIPINIPNLPSIVGIEGFAQGATMFAGNFGLTNALTFSLLN